MTLTPPALRPFQADVLARARDANVVMVGATGIGKTFVAIALLSEQDYGGGKRAFVLAPTRQLVWQIAAKIRAATTLRAGAFCGKDMEQWGAHEWARELLLTRVFVCTPEVLRNALERGLVAMRQINLLVFDECHHVTKRHPYAHVIKMYDPEVAAAQPDEMPRVFGATATPTRDCATNLYAEIFQVKLDKDETVAFAAAAPIVTEGYEKEDPLALGSGSSRGHVVLDDESDGDDDNIPTDANDADKELDRWLAREFRASALHKLYDILTELRAPQVLRKLLRKGKSDAARDEARLDKLVRKFVLSCVEIFKNLGVWCVYRFVEMEIERSAMNASLLLSVPGSMFGYDKAAITLIMLARQRRSQCAFAATKRLEKVASLLEARLPDAIGSSTTSSLRDDEDESELELDDDESQATTEATEASLLRAELANNRATLRGRGLLQGIIFVTTRAECRAVCEYLNERLGDNDDDDSASDADDDDDESDDGHSTTSGNDVVKDPRFACILGQASSRDTASFGLPKMEETLDKFEKGAIPFLVSTAVSIEGVDFPQCALVIVASRIQAARKLMQLRGRARHEDGVVHYLVETGDHEHEMHVRTMLEDAEAIDKLDFTHDKQESVFQQPRTRASQQLVGFDFFPDESRLCIAATGAVLDLDSSIARLNMFCQTLPKQVCVVDLKNMYTYEQTTLEKRPLFRAKVHMPAGLDLPVFESERMHSKATAKAVVAFTACKYLYENGFLDDSLNSVYRKAKPDDLSYLFKRLNHHG